jgi:hypothetical protein
MTIDQTARSALRKSLQVCFTNGIVAMLNSMHGRGKLSTRYQTAWRWVLTICLLLKHNNGNLPPDKIKSMAKSSGLHPIEKSNVLHHILFSDSTLDNVSTEAIIYALAKVDVESIRTGLPKKVRQVVPNPWESLLVEDIGSCYEIVKELKAVEIDSKIELDQIGVRRRMGIHHTPYDVTEHMSNLALEPLQISDDSIPDDLVVADLAVGAGAFLVQIARIISNISKKPISDVFQNHVIGFDIDKVALQVCSVCFFVEQGCDINKTKFNLHNLDSIGKINSREKIKEKIAEMMPASKGCPTIVIGNPPYVKILKDDSKDYHFASKNSLNMSAYFIEQAINITEIGKVVCQIVPLSITQSKKNESIQKVMYSRFSEIKVDAFDCVPGYLFDQGKIGSNTNNAITQRTVIITGVTGDGCTSADASRLIRWKTDERPDLFDNIQRQNIPLNTGRKGLSLVGDPLTLSILNKVESSQRTLSDLVAQSNRLKLYIPNAIRYFTSASRVDMNREQIELNFTNTTDRNLVHVLINSSYYYWYWRLYASSFNISKQDILNLPIPDKALQDFYEDEINNLSEYLHRNREKFKTYKMNKKLIWNLKYETDEKLMARMDSLVKKLLEIDVEYNFASAKSKSLIDFNSV